MSKQPAVSIQGKLTLYLSICKKVLVSMHFIPRITASIKKYPESFIFLGFSQLSFCPY